MKIKAINWMLFFLCAIAGAGLVFYSPMTLFDLITGAKAEGFSITWPLARYFTEPFYAFSFYGLTLERAFYKPAVISWAAWTAAVVFIYSIVTKKTVGQFLIKLLYGLVFLATFFVFVAFIPLPGPKLNKPEGYVAADIHSHTVNSHDNISLPCSNLKFHRLQGFDFFFITEHNHTKGFNKFPEETKGKEVFPGMQMQTKDGVSVLLLSSKQFDGEEYKNLRLPEIIEKAHKNNMLVIMPHWWKWHKHTFNELKGLGIDGFEIYNTGYRYFDEEEMHNLIDFSNENKLMMFGTTDWHGWGYMTDVWTVFKGSKDVNLQLQLSKNPETKVILYREKQSAAPLRFVFEPFMAFYYYVKNAEIHSLFAFMAWFAVIFIFMASKAAKYIVKYVPLILAAVFGVLTVCYYLLSLYAQGLNQIIPFTIVPASLGFCLLWAIIWRLNGKTIQ